MSQTTDKTTENTEALRRWIADEIDEPDVYPPENSFCVLIPFPEVVRQLLSKPPKPRKAKKAKKPKPAAAR